MATKGLIRRTTQLKWYFDSYVTSIAVHLFIVVTNRRLKQHAIRIKSRNFIVFVAPKITLLSATRANKIEVRSYIVGKVSVHKICERADEHRLV